MREIFHFLKANDAYFTIGLSALVLILLSYSISLSKKIAKVGRRRNEKLEDGRLEDILDCMSDQLDSLEKLQRRLDEISARQQELAENVSSCLRYTGIVRFDAFDDVGGEQSFSLVLLDGNKNGVAVSSIYGRHDARIYAKGIADGKGERPLSTEEQHALTQAMQ